MVDKIGSVGNCFSDEFYLSDVLPDSKPRVSNKVCKDVNDDDCVRFGLKHFGSFRQIYSLILGTVCIEYYTRYNVHYIDNLICTTVLCYYCLH